MRTRDRNQMSGWILGAGLVAAGMVAKRYFESRYSFRDKVVVISGGSRGLGLAMARRLAREGAHLALIARSRIELDRAENDLRNAGEGGLLLLPCDIRDQAQVRHMIQGVIESFGRVDVLINNAGEIMVGPLNTMTNEDWEDCMDLHFWAPLYLIEECLPHMRRGQGRIVNISSFGGKIAVPHLAPYCASKFALVGLSDAIRAELHKEGIAVTTVCPGLMRTGSHLNAMFKGDYQKEFAWFSTGAGSPLNSVTATSAARKIIEACRRGQPQLIISLQAKAAVVAQALFPNLFARAMWMVDRFMPTSIRTKEATERHMGWESRAPGLTPITRLADRANEEFNGLRGHSRVLGA